MTTEKRIENLELAVERLCDVFDKLALPFDAYAIFTTDLRLIKQLVRGELEPK